MRKSRLLVGAFLLLLSTGVAIGAPRDEHCNSQFMKVVVKMLAAKDYNGLILACEREIHRDSSNSQAYLYRGLAFSRLDRYRAAIADFEKGWSLTPCENSTFYEQAAHCYVAVAENDKALSALDRSLNLNPTPSAWRVKGELLLSMHRAEEALKSFNSSLKLQPDDYWLLDDRAICYAQMGRLQDALNDRDKLIKLRPKEPRGYVNRAKLYDRLGRKELAAADRKQVAVLSPAMDFMDTAP